MQVPQQSNTRSIGEVLALLKQEFDEITISKIRFLEGQGLINPQRSASGYRKFSDDDVERLRFILKAQKDQFLPLKVIKGRLKEHEAQLTPTNGNAGISTPPKITSITSLTGGGGMLGRAELLSAANLTEAQLRELEEFGLVDGQQTANGVWYDESALVVAKLSARLLQFGVEARHIRTFKTAATREADLYRQLAGPVLGSRNTQARMEAVARLEELQRLGEGLRTELLRQALQ